MYRESTVKRRKLGLKSVIWNKSKKEASNWNRMKKQEFKKMRRDLGTYRKMLSIPISKSQGVGRRRTTARN